MPCEFELENLKYRDTYSKKKKKEYRVQCNNNIIIFLITF